MSSYSMVETLLGNLVLVADETELVGLYFSDCRHVPAARKTWVLNSGHPVLVKAGTQLLEYLEGKRNTFSFPMRFGGTDFQRRVWSEIVKIPFGATITYSELAEKVGSPTAVRAAGTATGRNPISIFVPCHRVVGKESLITGYAGGVERKRKLLALESAIRQKNFGTELRNLKVPIQHNFKKVQRKALSIYSRRRTSPALRAKNVLNSYNRNTIAMSDLPTTRTNPKSRKECLEKKVTSPKPSLRTVVSLT